MARAQASASLTPLIWRRLNTQVLVYSLCLGVVCFLVLTPLLYTLINSFQVAKPWEPPDYSLAGWREALSSPGIMTAVYNTLSLAIVRQVIALIIGILMAWLLARTDIPMKRTLEFAFWFSFFMPALPVTLGWILALDPKIGLVNRALTYLPFIDGPVFNIYSYWGIVWAHLTASTLGVKVMFLTPAFRNMDAPLEEASRVAGASTLGTLARIVIPLLLPAILATTTLGLIRSLEAFEIELVLGVPIGIQVYSTVIHDMIVFDPASGYGPAAALSTFFLFILISLVVLQRVYLGRRAYTTVTGRFSTRTMSLGKWRTPIFIGVLLIVLTITIVPLAFLLMGTFMTLFGFFDVNQPWTLDHWTRVLQDPIFFSSLVNTIKVALGAVLLGIVVYPVVAYIIVKSRFYGKGILDFVSWLPWAVPGILLGVGLLWTFLQTPGLNLLYGTIYLMAVAILIKSMPMGVQLTKSVLLQLGDELEEASKTCGATWIQTYRRIIFPLIMPMLVVVGLLVFNSAARDISTVVLLGTGESRTLSLLMLEWAVGAGAMEKATVVGAIIVLIVGVTSIIARTIEGRMTGGGK
jgi:iron(III) transport system permease protein